MNSIVCILAVLIVTSTAEYTGNVGTSANNVGGASGASSQSGTGFGYGFSGVGAGSSVPYEFNGLLAGYFNALYNYHQLLLANIQAASAAQAANAASLAQANAAALSGGYGFPGGFGYAGGLGFIPAFNNFANLAASSGVPVKSAGASASIGGGASQQTAYLNPENPASPNVNVVNRFGPPASGDGAYGVFTSSSIHASNVDGKESVHRQATTSVNENGKVTSYTVNDRK